MPDGVWKVREYVKGLGIEAEFRDFQTSTKNSVLAAQALGCTVAEIAKSVVFVGEKAYVVVLSGDRRVDSSLLARLVGGEARLATPEEVKVQTGYPVGGVPPFPHGDNVRVLVDSSLTRFDRVWVASGAPNSVLMLRTMDIMATVGGLPQSLSSP